jgi:uncharacterized SAM-binding protein YcdF (DUF218 family)
MSLIRGALLAILTALALAGAAGFVEFARAVHGAAPAEPTPPVDAIVALTGGSNKRLETAMTLLEQGHGRRLLISGVNPKVKDDELAALLGADAAMFACCVDVGRTAEDTLGNASETAAWTRRNGFDTVLVVTDDYHMPRSLVELRLAMPEMELIAYPVRTRVTAPRAWQTDIAAAGRLGSEYVKLLVVRARERLLAIDKPPEQPPAA